MYVTNCDEYVKDMAGITCALLLDSVPAVVLFDAGSTHVLIARTFIHSIGVGLDDLGYDLVVTTLVRAILTTQECMRDVVVAIK